MGPWHEIDWKQRFSEVVPPGATFIRIPEVLAEILKTSMGDRIEISDAQGHWDYLYDLEDLVALQGNRFHKKKNLVNQSKKKHDFTLVPLGPDFAKEALLLQEDWCLWRDCESIEALV
jgi:hypothetical protein